MRQVFNSLWFLRSLLQAAAVVMRDGPLVVLGGADVLRDCGGLVVAVVVAPHLLGVVHELPGEERLHLKHAEVRTSDTNADDRRWVGGELLTT